MSQLTLPTARPVLVLLIVGILFLTQGCTTVKEGFVGKEHEQIGPFAQKTVEMLAVQNIQVRDNELIELRRYVDDSFVELDALQETIAIIDGYRDEVIAYSIDLVRLVELYNTDAERIEAYAERIEQHVGPIALNRLGITEQEWRSVVADIRKQERLLDALRAFQPVINRAARKFDAYISKIESDLMIVARKEFDRRIQAEYQHPIDFLNRQYKSRYDLIAASIAIDKYREGDKQAIAKFRKKDLPVSKLFTTNAPSEKQLITLEEELYERLKQSTELLAELDRDYADYIKVRKELDKKEAEVYEALSFARLQIATWTQAHQALANGVKDPGEWMEMTIQAAKVIKAVI
jgi:hypothetical protein